MGSSGGGGDIFASTGTVCVQGWEGRITAAKSKQEKTAHDGYGRHQ